MIILIAATFFALLFIGFPIAMAMGCAALLGIVLDPGIGEIVIAQKIYSANDSFALMAVPFFMLGGQIMEHTGITTELVNLSKKLVGFLRGGMAYTTIVTGMLMAGISGSANADAAAIGSITLAPMRKDGWDDGMAVSVVAAAGGLGPIIPPSIAMVIYCNLTGLSVGRMFVAGYFPGLLLGIGYMVIAGIYAKKHNMQRTQFEGWNPLWYTFRKAIWALIMPMIIIGGILTGIFTATEAGVFAAVYGIFYGICTKTLNFKTFWECAYNAVLNSAGPMAIIVMANVLGYMLTRNNLANIIADFVTSISSSYIVFYLMLTVLLLIAGMFIDGTATMLMLIPVLMPIAHALGCNELHFAMVFMLALQTGGLTPPVGALLFIVSSVGGVPLRKCVNPIIPFVCIMLLVTILIIFIPQIVTFLPGLLGY
jgi:C4-dicarboxylate transporter DctM subunit